MSLVLAHELNLDDIGASLNFLEKQLDIKDILCLKLDQLEDYDFADSNLYLFHLNLTNELISHEKFSHWALRNEVDLLNPYYKEANIFDDKLAFSQFALLNLHQQNKKKTREDCH